MEDWWLCRKPLVGTVVANVQEHGTGALNIDGCRIGDFQNTTPSGVDRRNAKLHELGYLPGTYQMGEKVPTTPPGRWPANLVHDGSPEVVELFPETGPAKSAARGTRHGKVYGNGKGPSGPNSLRGHDDSGGSAARFFYCAKASKADRDEDNKHPTVKPTALMRWLCRLITTPGGVILDPFMGSGSTGKAAMLEGFRFIGVERESEYMDIAAARIASVQRTQDAEPSKTATPVQACFAL
jgi:site-specific DNA-methyltransferase (adenine-specific)